MSLDDERIEAASNLRVAAMAAAQRDTHPSHGARRIANERRRQMLQEGYDAEHDRGHAYELSAAAHCYAVRAAQRIADPDFRPFDVLHSDWPWAREFWKPTGDPVRDLTKAGALIAAAIDSLIAEQARSSVGRES